MNGEGRSFQIGGVESLCYIDTGAAYSYVYNLSPQFTSPGNVEDIGFSGKHWTALTRHVPCELAGHPFEILCADAVENQERPNGAAVPKEGVIGYDFFNNLTFVVDRLGGKMTFIIN